MPVPPLYDTSAACGWLESAFARVAVGGTDSADLTRDLFSWLIAEPGLRGRVRIVEGEAPAYALGTADIVLEAALGPGGAVMGLVTIVVTWLRVRTGKVTVSFSSADGKRQQSLTVTAARGLDATDIRALAAQVSQMLADGTRGCDGARDDAA
jgi:hypothetical protein